MNLIRGPMPSRQRLAARAVAFAAITLGIFVAVYAILVVAAALIFGPGAE